MATSARHNTSPDGFSLTNPEMIATANAESEKHAAITLLDTTLIRALHEE